MRFQSNGSHKINGKFQCTTENLKKKGKTFDFGNNSEFEVMSCSTAIKYTFIDYLNGGMDMNFVIGIDFTASNGDGFL
jgi:hypothetical protein